MIYELIMIFNYYILIQILFLLADKINISIILYIKKAFNYYN